jgi:hypothetical protein
MIWRDTEYEDLHRIRLPSDPSDDCRSVLSDSDESRVALRYDAKTMCEGEKILAIAGVAPLWKGVGTVWTLISDEAREHGMRLSMGVYRLVNMLHVERGYWRLQATTVRGDEPARLWIVGLGFSYEGTMVAYGPDGMTHDMYARVREQCQQ